MRFSDRARQRESQLAGIERLGDGVVRRYVRSFQDRALKAIRGSGKVSLSKAERNSIVEEMADLMLLGFVKRYRSAKSQAGIELSFSRDVARIAKGFDLELGDIRKRFLTVAGKKVKGSVDLIEGRLNREIRTITARQQPTAIATRELRRRMEQMGLSVKHPVQVETLVRTHAQMAFAAAQYKLNDDDPNDVIWGYTYVTVGDARVRDEHAVLDGLTRPKNDPIWQKIWPPNGWNCRCQLIELTEPAENTPIPRNLQIDSDFAFSPRELLAA